MKKHKEKRLMIGNRLPSGSFGTIKWRQYVYEDSRGNLYAYWMGVLEKVLIVRGFYWFDCFMCTDEVLFEKRKTIHR